MADRPQSTTAPHSASTTSPPNPPYTPSATSIADDSETEYAPTPLSSPGGGPQYEDLPPSYDFALSDARNGAASMDASQIEAVRVSANEGPNDPEVWEYRMRGETTEADDTPEHEEAPAYEGHVPVQHIAGSESIPVGRVGGSNTSTTSATSANRSPAASEDPPYSIPDVEAGAHAGGPWSPFGQPGHGPFGAPGNGPFGASGNGPFGPPANGPFGRPGRGPFGGPGRGPFGRGRGGGDRRSSGSRSSQDWVAFGQNLGKMGEQLGRRVGSLGEQFGRQAGAMGQRIGRNTESWASAYAAGGGAYISRPTAPAAGPSNNARSAPPQYDEPPSYQGPAGVAGQESSVLPGDHKINPYPPEKVPETSSAAQSERTLGKQKSNDHDDDDDSSISSDSSDSSTSSSDSEDDDYDHAQANYLRRIDSINKTAETAASKGKKSRDEIEHERELAIAKATREREAAQWKIARKQTRRNQKRELKNKKRDLAREYRQKRRDLREKSEGKGKGKGKAKKGKEWKDLKSEYKTKRRALKRERVDAKREWKREKREDQRVRKESFSSGKNEQKVLKEM